MRAILIVAVAVAVASFAAADAHASEQILGGGPAAACAEATRDGKADTDSLAQCDLALTDEALIPADRGSTLVNRGVIHMRRKMFDAARADFDAGIALLPEVGEPYFDRAAVSLYQKRYPEALADLDKALQLGLKEPAKAYVNRAIAHEHLNDETAAYRDFEQAAVLAPDWDVPKKELQRFAVSTKR